MPPTDAMYRSNSLVGEGVGVGSAFAAAHAGLADSFTADPLRVHAPRRGASPRQPPRRWPYSAEAYTVRARILDESGDWDAAAESYGTGAHIRRGGRGSRFGDGGRFQLPRPGDGRRGSPAQATSGRPARSSPGCGVRRRMRSTARPTSPPTSAKWTAPSPCCIASANGTPSRWWDSAPARPGYRYGMIPAGQGCSGTWAFNDELERLSAAGNE
jgi:hypothetical protein